MAEDLRSGRLAVNAIWLFRLRWVAVAGQLLTVAWAATLFHISLPLTPILSIIALTATTNVLCTRWWRRLAARQTQSKHLDEQRREKQREGKRILLVVMVLDVLSLTALLYFAGGPSNPFTMFYFVNLALAAVILPARNAWALAGIALGCFLGLFISHVSLPVLQESLLVAGFVPGTSMRLQYQGLFVSLTACGSVVVYFITCVTRELRQREAQLRAAELQRSKGHRLESLATLAAGAAHELATPLSTIAVVTKELSRHLDGADVPESVLEDMNLIRSELDHCRGILDRLSTGAGQAVGESVTPVTAAVLVEEILCSLRFRRRVDIVMEIETSETMVPVPLQAVAQAIRGVVQNAIDATQSNATDNSESETTVKLSVAADGAYMRFQVRDAGPGMSREVLARAGDPFFTTKEPGKGMGLGLFLCRSVVERIGGTLKLTSLPREGVTAEVRLPLTDGEQR